MFLYETTKKNNKQNVCSMMKIRDAGALTSHPPLEVLDWILLIQNGGNGGCSCMSASISSILLRYEGLNNKTKTSETQPCPTLEETQENSPPYWAKMKPIRKKLRLLLLFFIHLVNIIQTSDDFSNGMIDGIGNRSYHSIHFNISLFDLRKSLEDVLDFHFNGPIEQHR
mmetsp:Transcript_23159/g.26231  ORF Transcript_23159/g.26231 Transcript_23159/m.26231 type:complete len:169 (+) Transcript_23159:1165-1671(+)